MLLLKEKWLQLNMDQPIIIGDDGLVVLRYLFLYFGGS